MTKATSALSASTQLTSNGADYIDVDAHVKLPDGSEFMQRMYIEITRPDALVRDDPRFSPNETADFDDGDVVDCPAEVMAAFDAAVPAAKALIQSALSQPAAPRPSM